MTSIRIFAEVRILSNRAAIAIHVNFAPKELRKLRLASRQGGNLGGVESTTSGIRVKSMELPLVPSQQMALIGDATVMTDPFSGKGIQFGMWAEFTLGGKIAEAISQKEEDRNLQSIME